MTGQQLSLGGHFVVGDFELAQAEERAAYKAIVARVGGKTASAATGLAESHLSKALGSDPGDRHLRDEHKHALLSIATPAEIERCLDARLALYGRRSGAISPRSLDVRHRDLEEKVIRMFGQLGAALVDEERARP